MTQLESTNLKHRKAILDAPRSGPLTSDRLRTESHIEGHDYCAALHSLEDDKEIEWVDTGRNQGMWKLVIRRVAS